MAQQPRPIFDGYSFDGWMTTSGKAVPDAWEVVDGTIHLAADRGRGGNIVTEELYGDFILDFEWKIAAGGNSGIKYRVREFDGRMLGCEFQILDDEGHRDGLRTKTSTGSLYDVYPPGPNKYARPIGEFNHSRIVVCGNQLEHWLNGQRIVTAEVGSPEWWMKIQESKFSDVEGFGENRFGRIMLTDHNSDVWYRNLQLTPLIGCGVPACEVTSERFPRRLRRFPWRCRRR